MPSPAVGIPPDGIVWISNARETRGFFPNLTLTEASVPPLKVNKRACHNDKMAYSGGVQFSSVLVLKILY